MKRTLTHRVVSKGSYSSDTRHYFIGTETECIDWVSQQEHPEYYEVGLSISEQKRQDMCRKLFGEKEPELTEKEENTLDVALQMKEDYDIRLNKSAESAASYMEDFINNMGCPITEFVALMTRKHRTLQQSFTKLCMQWIEKVASPEYTYDGRNEASHKQCKRLLDNWELTHPDDRSHTDAEMLKDNPPSKWLPFI